MKRMSILLLFIFFSSAMYGQHIHYYDPGVSKRTSTKSANIITIDCPGQTASLPVLTNYVLPELVTRMKERFNDHVYSITTLKSAQNKVQYRLKVCVKGQIRILLVDEEGNVVTK